MTRRPLGLDLHDVLGFVAVALIVGVVLGAALQRVDHDPVPAPRSTTSTSALPWCEGETLVIPGTGVVEFAPRCDQPVVHDPPGTGPTTGPNGEPHE